MWVDEVVSKYNGHVSHINEWMSGQRHTSELGWEQHNEFSEGNKNKHRIHRYLGIAQQAMV